MFLSTAAVNITVTANSLETDFATHVAKYTGVPGRASVTVT